MLTLSMAQVFAISVPAVPVIDPPVLEWSPPDGQAVHASLKYDPEWLKVVTETHVSHDTWIHVLGKDTFGQDVEAKTFIPNCTDVEEEFPLIDWHSKEPVTFAEITDVYQQGGEHCNSFEIETLPEPRQDYLGRYHKSTGYEPNYEHGFPVEPSNPDPIKVVTNWNDTNGDGIPQEDECEPPKVNSTITIKGLDQKGDVLHVDVDITTYGWMFEVDVRNATWSDVSTVYGGSIKVSYFIFTHPKPQRPILQFNIRVDHIEVVASPKNILADGNSTTTITITLLDKDGHPVHWTTLPWVAPVEINVATTGGEIKPSVDIEIPGCSTNATTTLRSDTNPRIVKVSALAILPEVRDADYQIIHNATQLFDIDLVGFDGINSVPHRPGVEIVDIGGTGSGRHYVVFRVLLEGCNLISIPVVPEENLTWNMLPCADQSLISVATYRADTGMWLYYDFEAGTGDVIPIVDGWAYWVKAEKPCTIVISGRVMDQYDPHTGFGVPPMYPMSMGWNLAGVTSIQTPINTADYLESLKNLGLGEKLWGPVWVYRYTLGWVRNPDTLYPTEGMWLFTYDGILAP